jgi:hypothetical protein
MPMPFCPDCGRPARPDESGLCDRCLSDEWRELRRRANVWDLDGLRASVDERPLPTPPRPASRRPSRSPRASGRSGPPAP